MSDEIALQLSKEILKDNSKLMEHYVSFEQYFLIMPFIHSEEHENVEEGIIQLERIRKESSYEEVRQLISKQISFAQNHL